MKTKNYFLKPLMINSKKKYIAIGVPTPQRRSLKLNQPLINHQRTTAIHNPAITK